MPEVAVSEDYYDIKSPLEVPFNWWPIMWVLLGALILIAGIWILIKYVRQRKHQQTLTPEQKLSPYDYAQLQIRELKEEKLWQNGQVKEYYSRLTDIMRLFMEHQLGLNAMESTADEVVEQTRELSLNEELQIPVEELHATQCTGKIRKGGPGAEDHATSMQTVANFIERHGPLDDTQSNEPNEKMTGKPRIT
ncbi:MAG: hypothetical protein U5L96_00555 [Owenweeksia sp.]|nr:hypothetical protein [Owenweeksia sp.]